MKLDFEGSGPAYKSYMGAAVSVIFSVMVTIFFFSKLMILIDDSHTTITTNLIVGGLDQSQKFTSENGLFVAAGLTEISNDEGIAEDERYGSIIF